MRLETLIDDSPDPGEGSARPRIVVVLGDGGVGKTTLAAAMGLRMALAGRRVLVVTVDPANRLRTALGLANEPGSEEPVPLEGPGSLHAMVLEARHELDRLVDRLIRSEEDRRRIRGNVFYRKAAAGMSGTHEYLALDRLLQVTESGRYDRIVLDTPPERHALDFLDAPDRLLDLLDSDSFRLFVGASSGLSRLGLQALKGRRWLLRGIGRFAGEDTFLAVLDFLLAFSPLFGDLRDRLGRVKALLAGPDTATLLVARPSPGMADRVRESAELIRTRGLRPTALLVNRVMTWPPAECPAAGAREPAGVETLRSVFHASPALRWMDESTREELARKTGRRAQEDWERSREDARRIAEAREALGNIPVREVPWLRTEVRDLEGLKALTAFL
ncbi:ArsA family ATPase [Myxococcota bacterium]|jgi:anion-transporting  ArsA/GET3 family ATPase|nr:ArsA family ATPase [Myxococcota bacterium]